MREGRGKRGLWWGAGGRWWLRRAWRGDARADPAPRAVPLLRWDCHGLPVEHEIDKALNITSRQDVLDMGIAAYNDECRKIVMRYSAEWRTTVRRSGRWIDFDNDYKTLDTPFMESVWWVFRRLHDKGLVYRGFKVMPFSTACSTPLSNFEAGLNYKDVADPAVMVSFPLVAGGGGGGGGARGMVCRGGEPRARRVDDDAVDAPRQPRPLRPPCSALRQGQVPGDGVGVHCRRGARRRAPRRGQAEEEERGRRPCRPDGV